MLDRIAMIEVVLLCIGIICWTLFQFGTSTFDYWRRRGVTYTAPTPFLGNIKSVLTFQATSGQCFQRIYNEHLNEPFVGVWLLRKPALLIRSPDVIKDVLLKHFQSFYDRGHAFDETREPITANLVNLTGEKWRILRQRLAPTFSTGKLRGMTPSLQKCALELGKYVSKSKGKGEEDVYEMRELMAKFTTDVIGSVAFGLELGSFEDENSQFREMGRKIFAPSLKIAVSLLFRQFLPSLYSFFDLRSFPKDVNSFFGNVVKDTVSWRKENNVQRNDFMQLLIQMKEEDAQQRKEGKVEDQKFEFTDAVMTAQSFIFFTAGFETSSTTLSYCLYELALNPDIQAKAVSEISRVRDKCETLNYESALELIYLEQILHETLRKYPPVMNLARVCTESLQLPGTKVKIDEGVNIVIPVYAIHHDPKYYPNPEKFDPDRFSAENIRKRPNYTYLPFGDGPRICIGMRFAYLNMKLCLGEFLRRFEVQPCSETVVPMKFRNSSFLLAPLGGIPLKVTKREDLS